MQTIAEFITKHGIKVTSERISRRPDKGMYGLPNHWKFRVQRGRKFFSGFYSGGEAITECDPANVIDCLATDIACAIDYPEQYRFARAFAMEWDEAGEALRACKKSHKAMVRVLGEDLVDELLYETERL